MAFLKIIHLFTTYSKISAILKDLSLKREKTFLQLSNLYIYLSFFLHYILLNKLKTFLTPRHDNDTNLKKMWVLNPVIASKNDFNQSNNL